MHIPNLRRNGLQAIAAACGVLSAGAVPALAADGDGDPAFSGDGKAWALWDTSFVQAETTNVTTLADGSVITIGWIDRGGNNRDFALAKFRPDGTPDPGFGTQGKVTIAFDLVPGGDDRAIAVFPLSAVSGQLVVVGTAGLSADPYQNIGFALLNADGSLDTAFGDRGKRVYAGNPWGGGADFNLRAAVQASDGKILVAGDCRSCGHGGLSDFAVARLFPTGFVDQSFGTDGWFSFGRVSPDNSWTIESANALAIDRQGRVVLAGYEEGYNDPDERQRPLLVRLSANGQLDTSFAGTGYSVIDIIGSWAISSVVADPLDASLVVSANLTNTPAATPAGVLLRVAASGTLDTSFGSGGLVNLGREQGTAIHALAMRNDRRILAAGWIDPNGTNRYEFFVARTLPTGALDGSFDGNGVARYAFDIDGDSWDQAWAISLSAQRPVIAGTLWDGVGPSQYASGVLRLQSDLLFVNAFE
ncbi:MAG: hypothetical protein J0L88_06585 [Xanthomonadales bacterium]|nr:hypothetical protein [Xanthomonadales bacterium]